jgi:hypothetical protein
MPLHILEVEVVALAVVVTHTEVAAAVRVEAQAATEGIAGCLLLVEPVGA